MISNGKMIRDSYFLIIKLSPFLSFMGCTYRARLYFFIRTSPIARKGGKLFQQVFIAHDPDTPWHLQSVLKRFLTICKKIEQLLESHSWYISSNQKLICFFDFECKRLLSLQFFCSANTLYISSQVDDGLGNTHLICIFLKFAFSLLFYLA